MRQAAQRLPSVQAARAMLESAQAYARSIGSQPNPFIKISASVGGSSEEANLLAFPFEISGQPRLRREIAESEVAMREQNLANERRVVALATGEAYYSAWEKREIYAAAQARTELARGLEYSSRRRYEVGEIAQNTHLRAQLELARALADEVTARTEAEQALGLLNLLLGRSPQEPLTLVNTPVALPSGVPVITTPPAAGNATLGVTSRAVDLAALQQRTAQLPEVQALRLETQTLQRQIDLARKGNAPTLQLQYYRDRIINVEVEGVQLSLTVPLWDWGQVAAEVGRAEGLARAAEARVAERELQLSQRVLEVSKRYESAYERSQILAEQAQRFGKLSQDARRAYDAGLMTLLEVFDVQQAYRAAVQAYVSAQAEASRAALQLSALDPHGFLEEVSGDR